MALNPYAKFLTPEDNPAAVIADTPAQLTRLLERIGMEQADQPIAPGKWSIREVVAHLADCEIVFAFRLRQALAEPGITIQPFDQDLFARKYMAYDLASSLATFNAVRHWNVRLLATVTEEERSNVLTHPERGTMTFWNVVETMAGHDRNHLLQIARYAEGA